jgi:acetyltransferase
VTAPYASPARAAVDAPRAFGDLAPLLAPRSVAVIGASDREGNLGGLAVRFLRKFGFSGAVWPVNAGRREVGGLPCFDTVRDLPGVPDLAIVAVPAESVEPVVADCGAAGVPAAVAWAGGFSEAGARGREHQDALVRACRAHGVRLCGPNCIGIINTAIGLTASFSSMLHEHDHLTAGAVSMVSQSGGIGVMAHSRAQQLGLGFRVTVSCGNEAVLGVADFVRALTEDDGTRVVAIYTEGLSDPGGFVRALEEARRKRKPVVVMKGGASEASGRAALAHTGRLAGADRTIDAIFRELAVIRVYSTEELLDVSLQLASQRDEQLPRGDAVLVTSFGGGSGVICTDQCAREGLAVPPLDAQTRARVEPLLTPLSSALNPVDFTPGMMTTPAHRANLPAALDVLAHAPDAHAWLFLAAGFGPLAPALVDMIDQVRHATDKPLLLTWQAMPQGTAQALAARGIYAFREHARAARTAGHIARYARDLRHRIRRCDDAPPAFDWARHVPRDAHVVSEPTVAGILAAAELPVAPGRLAADANAAIAAAEAVGYPVAMKGISSTVTHRAAAGLLALNLHAPGDVRAADATLRARAAGHGAALDGIWVQRMAGGDAELIVTAFRDAEFGVMIGVGVGGAMTEIVDDMVLARAPLDRDGALDLLGRLRTLQRRPQWLSESQRGLAADFAARFSALAASAPWPRFTLEVNPLKLGAHDAAAVDGLLIID